jgi:Family of unknown function (DUF5681)
MAQKKQKRQPSGDYEIGYCRPPAQHRFRPGQSGNPTGQRKNRQGKTIVDELNEIAATKVTIRDGQRTREVSLVNAILLALAMNGAKGDAKSAALFLNESHKLGLFDNQAFGDIPAGPQSKLHPSDVVLADLDPSLLSREEQVELSQFATMIDRAGDMWALSASDLDRVRHLVLKARPADNTRH